MGAAFDYAAAFKSLDLHAVKADIFFAHDPVADWWPADFGHYGPLFIRMAWHSAGTYRIGDGRGGAGAGAQRFAPLNSGRTTLTSTKRACWCGRSSGSTAASCPGRLLILTGNCALESMGLRTSLRRGDARTSGSLKTTSTGVPNASGWRETSATAGNAIWPRPWPPSRWGSFYVNPEGPNGVPDPLAAAPRHRETFTRMR